MSKKNENAAKRSYKTPRVVSSEETLERMALACAWGGDINPGACPAKEGCASIAS